MSRPTTLLVCIWLAFSGSPGQLNAQITITAEQFTAQTNTVFQELLASDTAGPFPSDLSSLETILLSNGNNNTFDFSGITSQLNLFSINEYLALPTDSLDIPGYEAFFEGEATDVWKVDFEDSTVPDAFLFRKINADSLIWLGNGIWQDSNGDGTADPVVSVFNPGKLQAPLPLQLNDAWTSDFTHISVVNTPIGVVEIAGVIESHDIVVDGYGTLITHEGSYACLRVRINQEIQNPDGSRQEIGGWSFVTAELVQFGVFYDRLIPDDPADISFDFQQPQSISLFSSGENEMSTAVDDHQLPASFTIGQNYPNPFNPTTSIPIEVFSAGHVRLSIYNALGQLIDTPLDDFLPAGPHNIVWQAIDQPAGPYFYRLNLNGAIQQRTMTLLK